jgi:hypothetical protein
VRLAGVHKGGRQEAPELQVLQRAPGTVRPAGASLCACSCCSLSAGGGPQGVGLLYTTWCMTGSQQVVRDVFQQQCCPVRTSQPYLEDFLRLQARHLDRLEGGERGGWRKSSTLTAARGSTSALKQCRSQSRARLSKESGSTQPGHGLRTGNETNSDSRLGAGWQLRNLLSKQQEQADGAKRAEAAFAMLQEALELLQHGRDGAFMQSHSKARRATRAFLPCADASESGACLAPRDLEEQCTRCDLPKKNISSIMFAHACRHPAPDQSLTAPKKQGMSRSS